MSVVGELVAVAACVAAIVSAYNDGSDLLNKYKRRRQAKKALREGSPPEWSTQELELSLANGQHDIQNRYDQRFRRLGEPFATGDSTARDTLKDIIIHLQGQVILNLKIAWQEDTAVDFLPLTDAAEESHDRAVLCLMQLQQRLLVAAPINEPMCIPLREAPFQGFVESPSRQTTWGSQPPTSPPSRTTTMGSLTPVSPTTRVPTGASENDKRMISNRNSPPRMYTPSRIHNTSAETERRKSMLSNPFRRSKGHEANQPHIADLSAGSPGSNNLLATTPPNDRFHDGSLTAEFGLGISPVAESPAGVSRFNSVSTGSSVSLEPDHPEWNPWSSDRSSENERNRESLSSTLSQVPAMTPDRRISQASSNISYHVQQQNPVSFPARLSGPLNQPWHDAISPDTVPTHRTRPVSTATQSSSDSSYHTTISHATAISKSLLPGEDNNFAGFCKGAWRLQIGERRKAIEERARPSSMYVAMSSFWKCTKCHFEGRMTKDAKGKKSIDNRVYNSDGILYKWEFLFKSHVHIKDGLTNPLESTFGCVFCCAEGKGTPIFGGVQNFLAHLQRHREHPPVGEVVFRMKSVAGREPRPGEEFNIVFPSTGELRSLREE